jgi:hypothetical protein
MMKLLTLLIINNNIIGLNNNSIDNCMKYFVYQDGIIIKDILNQLNSNIIDNIKNHYKTDFYNDTNNFIKFLNQLKFFYKKNNSYLLDSLNILINNINEFSWEEINDCPTKINLNDKYFEFLNNDYNNIEFIVYNNNLDLQILSLKCYYNKSQYNLLENIVYNIKNPSIKLKQLFLIKQLNMKIRKNFDIYKNFYIYKFIFYYICKKHYFLESKFCLQKLFKKLTQLISVFNHYYNFFLDNTKKKIFFCYIEDIQIIPLNFFEKIFKNLLCFGNVDNIESIKKNILQLLKIIVKSKKQNHKLKILSSEIIVEILIYTIEFSHKDYLYFNDYSLILAKNILRIFYDYCNLKFNNI